FLKRGERGQAAFVVGEGIAGRVELARDARFLLAQVANFLPDGIERACRLFACAEQPLLVPRERSEALLELFEREAAALGGLLLPLLLEPVQLRRQLLEARGLDMRRALGHRERLGNVSPALAPLLHARIGPLELFLRRTLLPMRVGPARPEFLQHLVDLSELHLIVRDVCLDLAELPIGSLGLLALPLQQVLPVLDRLLEARDLRADLVVVALHDAEAFVALRKLDAELF